MPEDHTFKYVRTGGGIQIIWPYFVYVQGGG